MQRNKKIKEGGDKMGKMYGLTFNGKHCSELGLTLMSSPRPIMAENKDDYTNIPGLNGSVLYEDSTLQDVVIDVVFVLDTKTREETITAGYAVGEWLTTAGLKPLTFDDHPARYYEAKAYTGVLMEPEEGFEEIAEFKVTFRCNPIMKEVV